MKNETKCECPTREALATIQCYCQPRLDVGVWKCPVCEALSVPCPCEGLRDELTEAREYALEAMSSLKMISESAQELSTILREQWKVPPNIDDTTIYCTALLAGFASAWKENPPKNGVIHAIKFADLGTLEIEIRRIGGKSAAKSLSELKAERDQLRSDFIRKIHDYSDLWRECKELRDELEQLKNAPTSR